MAAPNRPPNANPLNPNPNPSNSNPFAAPLQRPSTLYTARPLIPNPVNHNPNPNSKGILYPVSSRPPSGAGNTFTIPSNATVYARPSSHVPHQHHQSVYGVSTVQNPVRAPVLSSFGVPRPAGPPAQPPLGPTLKGVPIPSHAKVHSLPTVAPTLEYTLAKERERNREEIDSFIVINDRKARLTDGDSSSLYSLCRSWVKNGIHHVSQSNNGNNERLLPRPLPVIDTGTLKIGDNDDEDNPPEKEYESSSVEGLTTRSLLEGHIKRAKRVRARLQKERLIKIRRYKQRLSLLLPTPPELIRPENQTPAI